MKRTAIFVDAGYLYAQGSAALQGTKAKRETLTLDHLPFLKLLRDRAKQVQPYAEILRVYWYDGTSRGPTPDHRALAELDDVKLRLGFINSAGQQKGVDSLLVTDLVELSRNGATCDALLLGGDEDLRIGVQIAQSFGVRVHLLGIAPARGSQSLNLRQEADTKHEISAVEIATYLKIVPSLAHEPILADPAGSVLHTKFSVLPIAANDADDKLRAGIDSVLTTLTSTQIAEILQSLEVRRSVPTEYDRRILASCRTSLGRDLTMEEKKQMRVLLRSEVESRNG